MRILVTGVTGQVGGALIKALPAGTVTGADRNALDLSRPTDIAAALNRLAPELIINPAAYTAVDRAEDERDLAFRVNGEAPEAIGRWAAAHHVPLVHFSTDYVFDGAGSRPWREDDPPGPLSVYGASKLAGERAIRASGAPHLIVRTSWVYAARGTNFLRTIARLARERLELRIVADQVGAPTPARLIAEAISRITASSSNRDLLVQRFAAACGCVHLAASGETSWHGFALAILAGLRARGVALPAKDVIAIGSADYPTKARRPANSRLDLSRLAHVFGIDMPPWDRALAGELDLLAAEFG